MSALRENRTADNGRRTARLIRFGMAAPAVLLLLSLAFGGGTLGAAEEVTVTPAGAPTGAAGKRARKLPETVFELIVAGGPVMIPIGLCSLLALGIAFERLFRLRRNSIAPPDFLERLKKALGDMDAPDVQGAINFCHSQSTTIAEVFRAGIARLHQGPEAIEKGIEDAGARAVHKMKRSLRPLSSIANLATLLGLLGTVYGLINAFQASTHESVGKADMLAAGIYVALVTTAAGLTVAIPTLVVYLWFCTRVDKLVDSIDEQAIEFVEYAVLRRNNDRIEASAPPPSTKKGEPAITEPGAVALNTAGGAS